MLNKNPEGYKKLLVYQKAQTLHREVLDFVSLFPKTKTFIDLADQISRSMRSTEKNLVEGWKRTTTKEYFDFLSFSIGSNAEMMEDLADITSGLYKELMGIKGIMGERGVKGAPSTPSSPIPLTPIFHPLPPLSPKPARRLKILSARPNPSPGR
jgi:four helix bundle protein